MKTCTWPRTKNRDKRVDGLKINAEIHVPCETDMPSPSPFDLSEGVLSAVPCLHARRKYIRHLCLATRRIARGMWRKSTDLHGKASGRLLGALLRHLKRLIMKWGWAGRCRDVCSGYGSLKGLQCRHSRNWDLHNFIGKIHHGQHTACCRASRVVESVLMFSIYLLNLYQRHCSDDHTAMRSLSGRSFFFYPSLI